MNKELKGIIIPSPATSFVERLWVLVPAILLIGLLLVYNHHDEFSVNGLIAGFDQEFLIFLYWRICTISRWNREWAMSNSTSFLLAYGIRPAISSTGHHGRNVYNRSSAISHHRFKTSTKKLVRHLLIPGVCSSQDVFVVG
jgi:hypothetical protein